MTPEEQAAAIVAKHFPLVSRQYQALEEEIAKAIRGAAREERTANLGAIKESLDIAWSIVGKGASESKTRWLTVIIDALGVVSTKIGSRGEG